MNENKVSEAIMEAGQIGATRGAARPGHSHYENLEHARVAAIRVWKLASNHPEESKSIIEAYNLGLNGYLN